jgi:homoserine dehydrogenase
MLAPDILFYLTLNNTIAVPSTEAATALLTRTGAGRLPTGGFVVRDVNAIVDAATDAGMRVMAL